MKNDTLYNLAQGIIMKKLRIRFYILYAFYTDQETELTVTFS